jgi:hypothetical protein
MLMKRLTFTLTDEAARVLQERVQYHEKGAYVSRLIEADQGVSALPPEEPTLWGLQAQIAELETRIAQLEAERQPPTR